MSAFDRILHASLLLEDNSLPSRDYSATVEYADSNLVRLGMGDFILELFGRQKAFSEYLGVAESTVTGWMKSGEFPLYARRAALGAWFIREHRLLSKRLFDGAGVGTIVRDGDTFLIVNIEEDEVGISKGTITARGIPTFEEALSLTSVRLAWKMANDLLSFAESADYRYAEERDEAHALAEATRMTWAKFHDHARLLEEYHERRADVAALAEG